MRHSHLPVTLLLHISLHFETDLQFDITGNAARVGYLVTLFFFAGSILCPFRLKLLARLRLIGHAPIQVLLQAAFELALPRDFEFRHGIRDRRGVQGSQNNDRQVDQHLYSLSCVHVVQNAMQVRYALREFNGHEVSNRDKCRACGQPPRSPD